jgi:hypothetical protein
MSTFSLSRLSSFVLCSSFCLGEWVAIDTTSSQTCSPDSTQSSVLTQVGVCLPVPSSFPSSLQQYSSYIFDDCAQDGDIMKLTVTWYLDDDCKGKGFEIYAPVDSSCENGVFTSCQDTPVAIEEEWPAVGLYSGDSSCEDAPTLISAYNPGCADFSAFGEYSTSVSCDTTFDYITYNASSTCSGDASMNISSSLDVCERISFAAQATSLTSAQHFTSARSNPFVQQATEHAKLHINSLSALMQQVVDLSEHSITSQLNIAVPVTSKSSESTPRDIEDPDVWYHYVSCSGVEDIPGVKSHGGSSNDDDDYNGLGKAGLAVLLIFIIIGLFASLAFARHVLLKKRKDAELKSRILGDGDESSL